GMATAEETNKRFRYLLDHGQTGLSVAFDLPTQMGYDSDADRAEGEVGKTGVAIDSVEDMKRLFAEIPLDQVTTSMTINATDAIAYLQAAIDAGLKIDDFGPRLSFFFACHMNFFEEVAKFRAARRMWSKIVLERFGAKDEKSAMLRFHTQTGGATLTAQQPENN